MFRAVEPKLVCDAIALGVLNSAGMKYNGQGEEFRKALGSWSPAELQKFIECKSENMGKGAVNTHLKYASQKCSRCGYTDLEKRHGSEFKCRNCGFGLNTGLNTSEKSEVLGRPGASGWRHPASRCGSIESTHGWRGGRRQAPHRSPNVEQLMPYLRFEETCLGSSAW